MIKRIMIAVVAMLGIATSAMAKDNYAHDASVLPTAAQTAISKNFKAKVSIVKIDKDFGRVSEYDVILTDGTEITFDRNGNWKNVEIGLKGKIPSAFVSDAITQYVKRSHPGQKIVGIEKEKSGFEVELSNGVDLKFDREGKFLRYD